MLAPTSEAIDELEMTIPRFEITIPAESFCADRMAGESATATIVAANARRLSFMMHRDAGGRTGRVLTAYARGVGYVVSSYRGLEMRARACLLRLCWVVAPAAVADAQAHLAGNMATPRALDLPDYYRVETAAAPAISPDGRRVAYVRT